MIFLFFTMEKNKMKMISKLALATLVSFSLVGSAFAAAPQPSYDLNQSKMDVKPGSKKSEATIFNKTSEYYTIHTVYIPSGRTYDNTLNPVGYDRSYLVIPIIGIDYDDYAAHVSVIRNSTGRTIWDHYVSSGNFNIVYTGKDTVTMEEHK